MSEAEKPDGWAVCKAETVLMVRLAHSMAEEDAYCTKKPSDFDKFEEWVIYKEDAIRKMKFAPDNPYRIRPVKLVFLDEEKS